MFYLKYIHTVCVIRTDDFVDSLMGGAEKVQL